MRRNFKDPKYIEWRKNIYTRDNFKCQWPNCNIKQKLNAHHIYKWADFPGLRYHINNGITLCKTHHDMIKNNEDNYRSFFSNLVLYKLKN
jgi:predicted restriction endonuclease